MEENDAAAEQQTERKQIKRLEMEYKYIVERKRNGRAFTSCNGSRKFLREMNNFQSEKEKRRVESEERERET